MKRKSASKEEKGKSPSQLIDARNKELDDGGARRSPMSARQPARLADDKPVTLLPADQRAL
jgi:hypothetical protein